MARPSIARPSRHSVAVSIDNLPDRVPVTESRIRGTYRLQPRSAYERGAGLASARSRGKKRSLDGKHSYSKSSSPSDPELPRSIRNPDPLHDSQAAFCAPGPGFEQFDDGDYEQTDGQMEQSPEPLLPMRTRRGEHQVLGLGIRSISESERGGSVEEYVPDVGDDQEDAESREEDGGSVDLQDSPRSPARKKVSIGQRVTGITFCLSEPADTQSRRPGIGTRAERVVRRAQLIDDCFYICRLLADPPEKVAGQIGGGRRALYDLMSNAIKGLGRVDGARRLEGIEEQAEDQEAGPDAIDEDE